MSGIIFVVLALAWALYLIPKALRHHDEVARTRSIDRFSTAMRVLARREPVNRRDARLVVTPRRRTSRMLVPGTSASSGQADRSSAEQTTPPEATEAGSKHSLPTEVRAADRPVGGRAAGRAAARAAAKRRRRILVVLLLADVATATVAALALTPWWAVAIPGGLTLLYLVLCRTQVRRDAGSSARVAAPPAVDGAVVEGAEDIAPRRAVRVDVASATVMVRNTQGFEEVSPDEDTVTIPASALTAAVAAGSIVEADAAAAEAVATVEAGTVPVDAAQGGSLWDPLPVTLPTYVSKPRATRTVRTIDLSAPDTWTSGRSEEDSKLVEDAEAAQQEESQAGPEEQRAVGS